ncbi:MAG TPA: cysteine--tRNA ligase [Tepidisphaeraceae bacterium]|jgi:cysteinyl-tRNA synthetase|nr:cysteine--tRNA ligase [Tepidisphaeraceae bacterium]
MSLRVYNTLTKQKDLFEPVRPGKVGMYLCGPTVYKPPHIGHMVGPVIFDAVKRYLKYKGYDVTWVVNITDVDDKLIEAAAKHNTTIADLATRYTKEYLDCLAGFGIDSIDAFPKASEHMNEILQLCERLIAKGVAYPAEGNVYFDVTKDADYGKLSNRRVEEQESGLRTLEGGGKRNPADFALWKAAKAGEPHWPSPWGNGRPGWHIECSAMSMKYLGETFDIHGGGMDLMFPHHENELAQSESATGKTFAKYWMHNGLTRIKTKLASGEVKDEKMSGSLGNVVSAVELLQQYGAELVRYMLLSTQYRRPIEFTDEVMTASRKGLNVFVRLFERIERLAGAGPHPDMDEAAPILLEGENGDFIRDVLGYKMKFMESMDDDFNTAGAIAALHELAGAINSFIERTEAEKTRATDLIQSVAAAGQSVRRMGGLLGLLSGSTAGGVAGGAHGGPAAKDVHAATVEGLMQLLIRLRTEARASKNFALADDVRKGLTELGITLEDRADGTVWRKE